MPLESVFKRVYKTRLKTPGRIIAGPPTFWGISLGKKQAIHVNKWAGGGCAGLRVYGMAGLRI